MPPIARADARSDLFALGAILYEMTTGRRAFEGTSASSILTAVLTSSPPPMTELKPLTPPAFDRTVKKCLVKDPAKRWQTAADLRDVAFLTGWKDADPDVPILIDARREYATLH
jgi:serine/threonine protein kinase